MARYPRKSDEERLEQLNQQIAITEEKLAQLNEEKEKIQNEIYQKKIGRLLFIMDEHNMSFEQLEQMLEDSAV